jgi:hypothetical protein
MVTPSILQLIERLEADLAALKKAVAPVDEADEELRRRAAERATTMRRARGGGR